MSNILEFTLKLRDLMSGGMVKVASATEMSFKRIDTQVARTQQGIASAGRTISNVAQQARSASGDFERLGNKAGSLFKTLAPFIGVGAATGFASSAINAAMQAQAQKASFQAMAGNNAGGQLFGDLTKFAQDSIFGNELYQNAQTMLAFGASVKDVMPDLKMLGDVSMGNKERLSSLTLAFSQIRSTGRLMGQDLLQLVSAGFNPLQVMSEKTGISMVELKKRMEKGVITFDMVKQAFVSATSEGGKFYKMTDKIAETSFGKWEALKGQWSGALIDIGNVLLPFATGLMDAAGDTLHFLNISKSVPEKLLAEKLEVNSLVKSIVSLNENNKLRGMMLDTLKSKYPDILGNINLEKIRNSELLAILNQINGAYDKRIKIAAYDQKLISQKKEYEYLMQIGTKAGAGTLGVWDQISAQWSHGFKIDHNSKIPRFQQYVDQVNARLPKLSMDINASQYNRFIEDANSLVKDGKRMRELWGKDATKNWKALNAELYKAVDARKAGRGFDTSNIQNLLNWSAASGTANGVASGSNSFGGISTSAGDSVSSGGARPINITVHKFFDDINIHTQEVREGLYDFENRVKEVLIRTLQSVKNSG